MTTRRPAVFKEIPGQAPDIMRDYDLATLGYEETEFSVEGTALSYVLQGERGLDGQWDVTPGPEAPFRTRFVVRRPIEEARFSGTAVVEWHNVSAGIDAAPDWGFFHRHLVAQGHAWVGVSAQKVGIDGGGFVEGIHLKLLAPDRYNQLDHPGDAWSFDIYTQVAALLRVPGKENPLGGPVPDTLIAAGESQSAACLVTYINAFDPHAQVFNGFFVHGRPGVGVSIDGVFIPSAQGEAIEATRVAISAKGERIRQDVRVPVLVLQSETDVILLGGGLADQPDSHDIRVWEMAGAAHADTYTVSAGRLDDGTLSPERMAELLRPTTKLMIGNTDKPINAGPQQHYVAQAALAHLTRWAAGGEAPPKAPRLAIDGADRVSIWTNTASHWAAFGPHGWTCQPLSCQVSARVVSRSPCFSAAPSRTMRTPWLSCIREASPNICNGSRPLSMPRSRRDSFWRRTGPRFSRWPRRPTRSGWSKPRRQHPFSDTRDARRSQRRQRLNPRPHRHTTWPPITRMTSAGPVDDVSFDFETDALDIEPQPDAVEAVHALPCSRRGSCSRLRS